jgi:hypothetical protein
MTFLRLSFGHALALVAALALLLVMSMVWWSDKVAEQDRQTQHQILPQVNNDTTPSASQQEADAAARREHTAWEPREAIDTVILLVLIAAAGLAIVAAFVKASGRRGPPLSAWATVAGLAGALLLTYRIFQPPGPNYAAVVKQGSAIGLVCVGLIALGSRLATLAERAEPAAGEEAAPPTEAAPVA